MSEQNSNTVVGIDLGTVFSCMAHIDEHGKPEVLLNNDNRPLTASAVFFEGENIVVGDLARENAISSPHEVVTLVKREMGKAVSIPVGENSYAPEEISAIILKKLKQDGQQRLKRPVEQAVITVPAYFGAAERRTTRDAGEMAGLTVLQTLDEPVAAALAFGFDNPDKEATLLVYDLGGGTFDITLFKIGPAEKSGDLPAIEMISTDGNHRLGGVDWDDRIVNYVAETFVEEQKEKSGEAIDDPRDDPCALQDLRQRCEKAKIALAKVTKAKIACQCAGMTSVVELDRAKLKELTQDLLDLTEHDIDRLMADTGYTPDQIDQVLCVGGSTRLLMVREMLEGRFAGKVNTSVEADQCVAQGAAIMGQLIGDSESDEQTAAGGVSKAPPLGPVRIITSHSYGIAAEDANGKTMIYPLILKDEEVPCRSREFAEKGEENYALGEFFTVAENQTGVRVAVHEGDVRSHDEILEPDACRKVGEFHIDDLPSGRAPGQAIYVTFRYQSDLQLSVTALDVASGKEITGELDVGSGMNPERKREMTDQLARQQIQS